MNDPLFWQQPDAGRKSELLASQKEELDNFLHLESRLEEVKGLLQESERTGDTTLNADLDATLTELEKAIEVQETAQYLSGPYDARDALIAVHAGTGGTDAQDWAGMLLRMIERYCVRKGFTVKVLDEHRGEEAGIKSAILEARGKRAYGFLKSEHGVHRLVRISPFDAEKMRHTAFALIEVLPELDAAEEIHIDPKDIRLDTFLSSGHGGQSVQTTYSAVRITHLPTGIVVTCQNERSQKQNRDTAMKILATRLNARALAERHKEREKLRGEYHEAAWGNQIRSYVLHPYKMVKDHRTASETADPQSVLDGKLEPFVDAYLRWQGQGSAKKQK